MQQVWGGDVSVEVVRPNSFGLRPRSSDYWFDGIKNPRHCGNFWFPIRVSEWVSQIISEAKRLLLASSSIVDPYQLPYLYSTRGNLGTISTTHLIKDASKNPYSSLHNSPIWSKFSGELIYSSSTSTPHFFAWAKQAIPSFRRTRSTNIPSWKM